jgi:flagellar basal body-associated protein FliL
MTKQLFFILLFFCVLQSHSQKLVYKSNGNILNSENQQISPNQVRELLKDNEKLLANYNTGRSKKTVGNILLVTGPVFLVVGTFAYVISGFESGMNGNYVKESDRAIPKIIAYVGLAELLIAIPVKIGFSKKIRNVVTEYNSQKAIGYNQLNTPKLDLITNANGIGLRLSLN